jgi:hypothetical protein
VLLMVISLESAFSVLAINSVGVERNMGNALRVPLAAICVRSAAGLASFR